MKQRINKEQYLRYLPLASLFTTKRTREILSVNPTIDNERKDAENSVITIYNYNSDQVEEKKEADFQEINNWKNKTGITWINIDGLKKSDIEAVCASFSVHYLITEDILSIGQRPKADETEGVLYCLLNMLYYNDAKHQVEAEQISIVLGNNFLISFQEDAIRDVFNPIRTRLKSSRSQIRQRPADYLLYSMIDLIVDNYLGEEIELLEEEVTRRSNKRSLAKINQLRKELIVLKRNIGPVRDLVSSIIRSESELLDDKTVKYFKDVHDHISQAYDLSDNYRDVIMTIQDLYLSNVNLKMNEAMKIMAVVTSLLAPATVIGGIFGMNFKIIPLAENQNGFFITIAIMIIIPLLMISWFRRKGLL
jgi:magnesium transporter